MNEDPTEKLIRQLQEENDRLKKMMDGGKIELDEDDEELSAAGKKEYIVMLASTGREKNTQNTYMRN